MSTFLKKNHAHNMSTYSHSHFETRDQGSKTEAFPPFGDIKPQQRYDGKPQEYESTQPLGL